MQTGEATMQKLFDGMLIHCDNFFSLSLIYSLSHSEYKLSADSWLIYTDLFLITLVFIFILCHLIMHLFGTQIFFFRK